MVARTQAEGLAAAPEPRQTGQGSSVRFPIPIAAFRVQGSLGQLSASSQHYRAAAISGHIGHYAREKALAMDTARW
jgi:hypothetical protein